LNLTLEVGLALFVAIIVLRAGLGWRRDTWQTDVEQQFQMSMRIELYETLSRTELYRLQQLRTSQFIQSTQVEIRQAQRAANIIFRLFSQVLDLGAYFAVAVILSAKMTLFAVACGVLGALILVPLVTKTHALSERQVGVRGRMLTNLMEHLQGIRTARVLGLNEKFLEDFRQRCYEAAVGNSRLTRLASSSTLVFEVVAVLVLASFVYAGLTFFHVEASVFVVLLIVFVRIFPAIGGLQSQVQQFVSNLPSFRHYLDLLSDLREHEEVVVESSDRTRLLMRETLALRDVSFGYQTNGPLILKNVSLTITIGDLTAIGGQSGAGKSTLADIASGLLPPQSGEVLLDGRALDNRERVLWRREVGVVPQEGFLFDDTIRNNLLCVKPDASDKELWGVLDTVNARGFVEANSDMLDRNVGERGGLLSGGERQRLSIARALLRRPQLLILDEPTNNLDEASEKALFEVLEKLKRATTLLVISHDQQILERADRLFQVDGGQLVAESTRRVSHLEKSAELSLK
jgi:ABC-type multidrug transport system fused ATPase/permease subunit